MGYEHILFLKKGRKPRYAKRRTGIISVPQVRPGDLIHPHEKPAALLQILMKHSTRKRDFCVDPFGGSGSLPRAAGEMGRSALAIEFDRKNYELAKAALDALAGGMF
jgi:DNA modification methylase